MGPIIEIQEPVTVEAEEDWEQLLSAGITQKMTRSISDGQEHIHGIFRCDFAPNQDRYALNIPIHPALQQIPTVEAFSIDGKSRLRVSDQKKYGVRVEVVLEREPDASETEPNSCYVEIIILSECDS